MLKIHEKKPDGFLQDFSVVACIIEYTRANKKKILLLQRQEGKPHENKWGLPGGKIDAGETPIMALSREVVEETGIKIDIDKLLFIKKNYVELSDYRFSFRLFLFKISKKPQITLSKREHKDYLWISLEEISLMNVVGEGAHLKEFYGL